MTDKKYDAIVIGCGMGGMVTALMLANRGKKVVILEKNKFPGGRLRSYKKQGFTVDVGCHTISRGSKGPAVWPLERCGYENPIKFNVVRPMSRFRGETFKFPRDLKGKIPDEDYKGILSFFNDVKNFPKSMIPLLDKYTTEEMLDQYTKDEQCRGGVGRACGMYGGTPQWLFSAGEFVRCMQWEAECLSSGYPDGGCEAITDAYVKAIGEQGGEIELGKGVEQILIEDGKAVGVKCEDGDVYKADIVVSNADLQFTMLHLVGEDNRPADYVERMKNLIWGNAGQVFKVGLDTQYTDIKMLTQFADMGYRDYFNMLSRGEVPDDLNLMFVCASNFSPQCAPEGCQLWAVALALPQDAPVGTAEKLLPVIKKTLDGWFPGWQEHVMWEEYTTSDQFGTYLGEHGASIGLAQCPGQISETRPSQKTPIENLYQVGAEAGGHGAGIELAANSALELVDGFLKDF